MTLKIVDFEPWHVLDVMKAANLTDSWPNLYKAIREIETQNTATIMDGDVPVAVGGTMELWHGRHMAWAFVSPQAIKQPIALTRLSKRILNKAAGRIEASARADVETDIRWLEVLGFEGGGFLPEYGPDGSDHRSYVMYNKGEQ